MLIKKCHIQVLAEQMAVIVLVCFALFLVAWIRTLPQSRQAQAFISDLTRLEVGKSTFEGAKSLAQKYKGIPWWVSDGSMQCTYQNCVFQFAFENKPLTSTHLVPWVGLIGFVTVKDGIVVRKYIGYHRYAKRPFAYNVTEIMPPDDTPEGRGLRQHMLGLDRMEVDAQGIPSAVSVGLEPSASSDQKRRAYSVDTSCLSKLFGCSSASAFFPPGVPYLGRPYQTHTPDW